MNLSITDPPSRSLACQVPYLEVSVVSDVQQAMEAVLSGMIFSYFRSGPCRSRKTIGYCGVPAMPSLKHWFSIPR